MSRVFWDTHLFIYLVEATGPLAQRAAHIAARMNARGDQLITSTLTLGELLVKPVAAGDSRLAGQYTDVIKRNAILVPFDEAAAAVYASIRTDRTVKAPDAIQLSCAARFQVDLFITNDDHLSKKLVPGIQFITSLARAPF